MTTTAGATTTGATTAMTERARLRPSARLRILGWMLALTTLAVVGSLLLSRHLLLQRLDSEVNGHLEQEVDELSRLADGRDPASGEPFGSDVEAIFDTFLRRNVPADGEAYYTFEGGEFFLASTAPLPLGDDPEIGGRWARITEPGQGEVSTSAGRVRYLALPLENSQGEVLGVFVVANFLAGERDEIADVITTGLAVGGAMLVVAACVGWIVAGRLLRPIREVTDTARAITETDLARRIDVEGDDEVAVLARTFNDMLDRLETAFATQRAFVDDAGHELRTPITIVRGHLELLGDDPDERRETIALVTDELDRMSRIVDDLLLLAKLERPDFLRTEAVDAEPFTAELFAKAKALGDRDWSLAGSAEVTVVADPQRLTQAVMNLARNAVEHAGVGASIELGSAVVRGNGNGVTSNGLPGPSGPAAASSGAAVGGTRSVGPTGSAGPTGAPGGPGVGWSGGTGGSGGSAGAPATHVAFWVADTGPGIAPEEQSAIFERFARGGDRRRRSEGAGLGLAISRGVAEAHGGRVTLDSQPGAGARFTITIPTSPPKAAARTPGEPPWPAS
jgi:signal transduction histidine kinase